MRAPRELGSARSRAPGIPPLRRPAETDQPPQPRPNRQPIREGAGQARPDLQAGQHGSRLLVETAWTGSHTPVAPRAFHARIRAAAHRSRTSPPPASWPRSPGTCSATNRATLRATVAHPHQAPPARATLRAAALTGERPPVESVRPSGSTRPRRNAPPSGPCSSKRKRPICASSATRGQRAILILLALVAIGASFYLSWLLTIASNSRGAPSDAGIREPAARRVR
jgi:hypothetical protein